MTECNASEEVEVGQPGLRKALEALYLVVDESVANDIKNKVFLMVLGKNDEIARYRKALEKLRDGPGNQMEGWKRTWAHEVARLALNPREVGE